MKKRTGITAFLIVTLGLIAAGIYFDRFSSQDQNVVAKEAGALTRPHSPVLGPEDAPVTIVEFFDPSCEACRAFYPLVKEILAEHPNDVRLVLRYVLFHRSSEEAVRILEAARKQNLYVPVLEAVLAAQPRWHDDPQLKAAWAAAEAAGLDVERARADMTAQEITRVIEQDAADVQAIKIPHTPMFYVNGKPLPSFGPEQLRELVRSEVEQVNRSRSTEPR